MTIWNAILLGLVQGIAEFLPISSSGPLSILQNLFHMSTAENGHLFFDVLLHLGTLSRSRIMPQKNRHQIPQKFLLRLPASALSAA